VPDSPATSSLTSLILPVHNQADHIARIIESYRATLERLTAAYEVVVVPNACTDDSVEVCRELGRRDERVRTVEQELGGWGRAVKAGLAAAGGETLCYTNSARTSGEMLALMLAYAAAYPDVVLKANRRLRDSWQRRVGSLIYNLERRVLFDLATWDINGTPKIFPRRFGRLLDLSSDDDLIDAEFNVVCQREGYPVIEVPVQATIRHGGRSTTSYTSAWRMYSGALRLRRRLG
jgi:glycosyltransferase involved in cell wall biosynthesis